MDVGNICICCLQYPAGRDMKSAYIYFGKTEIYSDMLKECFEIQLTKLLGNNERRICEACVGRLRDAHNFKLQVLRSQAELQNILNKGQSTLDEDQIVKEETSSLKVELPDIEEQLYHFAEEIKVEIETDPMPGDAETALQGFDKTISADDKGILTSDVLKPEPTFEVTLVPVYPKSTTKHNGTRKYNLRKCLICGQRFENKDLLVKHKQMHKTCTKCNKQFKHMREFKHHLLTFCRRSSYICDLCKKEFERKSDLQRHKLVHFRAKPVSCDECDQTFTDVSDLNIHKSTHEQSKYTCDMCQVKFQRKHLLISHMGRHQGKKYFSCDICSKSFSNYTRLYTHTEFHTRTDKKYTCDECGKAYRFKQGLSLHLQFHTKSFSCNVCAKKFSTSHCLRRHEAVHTDRRPYPCESCHKSFRHKHHLERHRVFLHTGEKPYCCETCGKWFSQESNLKTHLQTHVKGNYPCELCTKSYATKASLRQHSRTHRKNGETKLKKGIVKKRKTKTTD